MPLPRYTGIAVASRGDAPKVTFTDHPTDRKAIQAALGIKYDCPPGATLTVAVEQLPPGYVPGQRYYLLLLDGAAPRMHACDCGASAARHVSVYIAFDAPARGQKLADLEAAEAIAAAVGLPGAAPGGMPPAYQLADGFHGGYFVLAGGRLFALPYHGVSPAAVGSADCPAD